MAEETYTGQTRDILIDIGIVLEKKKILLEILSDLNVYNVPVLKMKYTKYYADAELKYDELNKEYNNAINTTKCN